MALNTAKATAVLRDITQNWQNAVAAATPFYPTLCTVVPSGGLDEKYAILGNMPGVREWLGERRFNELRAGDYTLANKHWESSLLVQKTDIDDDRTGMYGPLGGQLGVEAAYHPDELLFTAINDGTSTACFDGQYFFDTDHAWGDSGTQSNDLTGDIVLKTAPTLAEFKATYHTMLAAMVGFKRDNGKYFMRPTVENLNDLVIMVPANFRQVATEMVNASTLLGSSGAADNIVLDRPRVVTSPHFGASPTTGEFFDLYYTGGMLKPYVFQARQPLGIQTKGLNDIEEKHIKVMTEARYNVGYGAWWTAVRYTFTTA
jgi:phage major head subunit gpT-like protein